MASMIPYSPAISPQILFASDAAYRGVKRARKAYEEYGPAAKKAAKTIGKAWKKYKSYRERTKEIGNAPGTANCKRALGTEVSTISTRDLQAINLVSLAKTTSNEITGRQRDLVDFRGSKICMQLANESTKPLCVNVAVVHPKDVQSVSQVNFFRGYGTERSQDFSNNLSANEFHCLPINSDIYTVLIHKRFMLDPVESASPTFSSGSGKSYRDLQFYVSLKRQLRYVHNGPDNTMAETGNTYLVWWCDEFLDPSGATGTAGAMRCDVKVYKYFKETAN